MPCDVSGCDHYQQHVSLCGIEILQLHWKTCIAIFIQHHGHYVTRFVEMIDTITLQQLAFLFYGSLGLNTAKKSMSIGHCKPAALTINTKLLPF